MNHRWHESTMRLSIVWVTLGLVCSAVSASADDWPQWRGANRDGKWHEDGLLEQFPEPRIPIKWRASISNGYSGPTVAGGRVYVTDRVKEPEEIERVLCFDEATGAPIWVDAYPCPYKVGYPDGPRAAVTVDEGLAYALGTMGHMRCLDAATGAIVWKKDPGVDYDVDLPIWGIAAAPLVMGDLVIAQIGVKPGGCIVAWQKQTGAERWRALDDMASYSAPILIEQAGRSVLVCWTGDFIVGLNPETGDVYWREQTPRQKEVLNVATPVIEGDRLFLTSVYDGSFMFRLLNDKPAVEQIWARRGESEKKSDALHAMISTPLMQGGYVYGVDCYGQLRCLDGNTGDRVWEDLTAVPQARWATIHMVQNGETVWMFNDSGELIIATLSPEGFHETSRAKLIEPTKGQLGRGDGVCWSHPAFANRHVFARNDEELICADLSK